MEINWNLDAIYASFEDKHFKHDLEELKNSILAFDKLSQTMDKMGNKELLEKYITQVNTFHTLANRLYDYASLILSANTNDDEALKYADILENMLTQSVMATTSIENRIGKIKDIEDLVHQSSIIKEHEYFIKEIQTQSQYQLTASEENIMAKMRNTGSNAFSRLKDQLIGNHVVDFDGEKIPLTMILNKASDKDKEIRKKAYEAEIKSYRDIELSIAACLNGIKGEVLTECALRGYDSPLEKTLIDSRMSKETLDVMLEAIYEALPHFQDYLKTKAKRLGYHSGLPFYELYAPVVDVDSHYDYQRGCTEVIEQFSTFSSHLASFATRAMEESWIDVYPKARKVGGAFCNNLPYIKESRILLNYGDSFGDVVTLAHELGHGFHGECLNEQTMINTNYPMPIAETASTFCETIIKKSALEKADKQEALSILETEICDCTQVIVDILSRFIFETSIFEQRKESTLSVEKIKELMIKAQKETYGDGLDPEYLHPYMWIWKPHYYYASSNFYNFPYAFGLLLAKGLYAMYLKEGKPFADKYEEFLSLTGKYSLEDVAKTIGVDLRDKSFWQESLKIIIEDIQQFKQLCKEI